MIEDLKANFYVLVQNQNKRVFFFVYSAGHGIAHHYQEMIINNSSGNKIALERELREISKLAGTQCHVFAVFDMCKSMPEQYPGLTYTVFREGDRGDDQIDQAAILVEDIGYPFHALSAAEL